MPDEIVELTAELKAVARIERILEELDEAKRGRVLRWVAETFEQRAPHTTESEIREPLATRTGITTIPTEYKDLADFYVAARPVTDPERALVVGYWFQYIEGETELDSQRVNAELKDLGSHVSNITRAFDSLKAEKPQLVVQTRKKGTARQARKRYKLTIEGRKRVEEMLAGVRDDK